MYNISAVDYNRVMIHDDHDSICITTGKYAGTIITYHKVHLIESTDGKDPILSFSYDVEESENESDELVSNDFKMYLGELIEHILWSAVQDDNFKIGNINASNPDTTKSINK